MTTQSNKSVLEILYEELLSKGNNIAKLSKLVRGRQRYSAKHKREMRKLAVGVKDAVDAFLDEIARREDIPVKGANNAEAIVDGYLNRLKHEREAAETELKKQLQILQPIVMGRSYKGKAEDLVAVPITMKPIMHQSLNGRWSWRTIVPGHSDFRHINVRNFHSAVQDQQTGQMYAMVNKFWVTAQPVFSEYCNSVPHDEQLTLDLSNEDANMQADFEAEIPFG